MYAYCPDCETELDLNTGICPACRWDPLISTAQNVEPTEPQKSLSERYRGTEYDTSAQFLPQRSTNVSRGRTFVVVGLLAAAGLYAIAMGVMGMV